MESSGQQANNLIVIVDSNGVILNQINQIISEAIFISEAPNQQEVIEEECCLVIDANSEATLEIQSDENKCDTVDCDHQNNELIQKENESISQIAENSSEIVVVDNKKQEDVIVNLANDLMAKDDVIKNPANALSAKDDVEPKSTTFQKPTREISGWLRCDVPDCGRHFATVNKLRSHMAEHDGTFRCDDCGKCCSNQSNLDNHRRSHSDDRPFTCDKHTCGMHFREMKTMLNHCKRFHPKKGQTLTACTEEGCEKNFQCDWELKQHLVDEHFAEIETQVKLKCLKVYQTMGNKYRCRRCGKKFWAPFILEKHQLLVHENNIKFQSKHDNERTKNKLKQSDLNQNETTPSMTDKTPVKVIKLDCLTENTLPDTDSESTSNKNIKGFESFIKPNATESISYQDPLSCQQVVENRDTITEADFPALLKSQENNRIFKCRVGSCDRLYTNEAGLRLHLYEHTIKFECQFPGCGKRCKSNYLLNQHQKIHNVEKPHVCDKHECGQRFRWHKEMTRHCEENHLKQWSCLHPGCKQKFQCLLEFEQHVSDHRSRSVKKEEMEEEIEKHQITDKKCQQSENKVQQIIDQIQQQIEQEENAKQKGQNNVEEHKQVEHNDKKRQKTVHVNEEHNKQENNSNTVAEIVIDEGVPTTSSMENNGNIEKPTKNRLSKEKALEKMRTHYSSCLSSSERSSANEIGEHQITAKKNQQIKHENELLYISEKIKQIEQEIDTQQQEIKHEDQKHHKEEHKHQDNMKTVIEIVLDDDGEDLPTVSSIEDKVKIGESTLNRMSKGKALEKMHRQCFSSPESSSSEDSDNEIYAIKLASGVTYSIQPNVFLDRIDCSLMVKTKEKLLETNSLENQVKKRMKCRVEGCNLSFFSLKRLYKHKREQHNRFHHHHHNQNKIIRKKHQKKQVTTQKQSTFSQQQPKLIDLSPHEPEFDPEEDILGSLNVTCDEITKEINSENSIDIDLLSPQPDVLSDDLFFNETDSKINYDNYLTDTLSEFSSDVTEIITNPSNLEKSSECVETRDVSCQTTISYLNRIDTEDSQTNESSGEPSSKKPEFVRWWQ